MESEKIEVDVADLPERFEELMAKAVEGADVVVTAGGEPRARLYPFWRPGQPRVPGAARGAVEYMAPDFNAPMMLVDDPDWAGK